MIPSRPPPRRLAAIGKRKVRDDDSVDAAYPRTRSHGLASDAPFIMLPTGKRQRNSEGPRRLAVNWQGTLDLPFALEMKRTQYVTKVRAVVLAICAKDPKTSRRVPIARNGSRHLRDALVVFLGATALPSFWTDQRPDGVHHDGLTTEQRQFLRVAWTLRVGHPHQVFGSMTSLGNDNFAPGRGRTLCTHTKMNSDCSYRFLLEDRAAQQLTCSMNTSTLAASSASSSSSSTPVAALASAAGSATQPVSPPSVSIPSIRHCLASPGVAWHNAPLVDLSGPDTADSRRLEQLIREHKLEADFQPGPHLYPVLEPVPPDEPGTGNNFVGANKKSPHQAPIRALLDLGFRGPALTLPLVDLSGNDDHKRSRNWHGSPLLPGGHLAPRGPPQPQPSMPLRMPMSHASLASASPSMPHASLASASPSMLPPLPTLSTRGMQLDPDWPSGSSHAAASGAGMLPSSLPLFSSPASRPVWLLAAVQPRPHSSATQPVWVPPPPPTVASGPGVFAMPFATPSSSSSSSASYAASFLATPFASRASVSQSSASSAAGAGYHQSSLFSAPPLASGSLNVPLASAAPCSQTSAPISPRQSFASAPVSPLRNSSSRPMASTSFWSPPPPQMAPAAGGARPPVLSSARTGGESALPPSPLVVPPAFRGGLPRPATAAVPPSQGTQAHQDTKSRSGDLPVMSRAAPVMGPSSAQTIVDRVMAAVAWYKSVCRPHLCVSAKLRRERDRRMFATAPTDTTLALLRKARDRTLMAIHPDKAGGLDTTDATAAVNGAWAEIADSFADRPPLPRRDKWLKASEADYDIHRGHLLRVHHGLDGPCSCPWSW